MIFSGKDLNEILSKRILVYKFLKIMDRGIL